MNARKALLALALAMGAPATAKGVDIASLDRSELGIAVIRGMNDLESELLQRKQKFAKAPDHPVHQERRAPHLFDTLAKWISTRLTDERKAELELKLVESNRIDSFDMARDCVVRRQDSDPRRLVFTFEGFGGYEPGAMYFLRETGSDGLAALVADAYAIAELRSELSDENRKYFERLVLKERPLNISLTQSSLAEGPIAQVLALSPANEWYYFSQDRASSGVAQAVACARKLVNIPYAHDADGTPMYPSLVVLGFSNGGHATVEFAQAMAADGVAIDLVFTIDPIPRDIDILNAKRVFWRPPNVKRWVNFFQRSDEGSMGGIPLKGHEIEGADRNVPTTVEGTESDHVFLPSELPILAEFTKELNAAPLSRASIDFDPRQFFEARQARGEERFKENRERQRRFSGPGYRRR